MMKTTNNSRVSANQRTAAATLLEQNLDGE